MTAILLLIMTLMASRTDTYFLPYQKAWIQDQSPLRIVEKGRQIGFSYADSYDSVRMVSGQDARLDVWVSSRDEIQARQYLLYCKRWAKVLNLAAEDMGEVLIDRDKNLSASCLRFANGLCVYSLSSNPDALAGKTGHIKLDEFALHKDQRLLYATAKPCTQWGGRLAIISTHRGRGSVFNSIITDIREKGNRMGWSLHSVPIQRAVGDGIVEKINAAAKRTETREGFLDRLHRECIDEEQWLQEYCCIPEDDAAAFIGFDLITRAETPGIMRSLDWLRGCPNPLYAGVDVGRKKDLTVIDVGERIGDVIWDRMRLELSKMTFTEQEAELYQVLELPKLVRCCMDNTGLGMQFAERAKLRCGYKVEPVTFSGPVKETLAYPLKAAFEDGRMRINPDAKLAADLRGVRKETTPAGNIRFVGDTDDSHCDRFWAMALRQHAANFAPPPGMIFPFQSSPRALAIAAARRECPL